MRLLLVHGYEPSGHASAAIALEACAHARGIETVRVNISADYHSVLGPLFAKAYLWCICSFPSLWSAIYDDPWIAKFARGWQRLYLYLAEDKLERRLAHMKPDIIVCTQAPPLAALALAKKKKGLSWPLIAAVTDYRAHRYWLDPPADLYLVATAEAAAALIEQGVARERVRETGIPVHPVFETLLDRTQARRQLGLDEKVPVLLLSGGSRGLGRMREVIELLLKRFPQAQILALCGTNEGLRRELTAAHGAEGRVRAHSPAEAEEMRELMAASDLLIGKAGGMTAAEALAVGLPILVFEPNPGQEAINTDYLVASGAAVRAKSLDELASLVEKLLAPGALEPLRRKANFLGRPASAKRALEEILARHSLN